MHHPEFRRLVPATLTWPEADPARHAFDPAAAPAVIRSLPPAAAVPSRPPGPASDSGIIRWGDEAGQQWADAMSSALVDHYGRWVCGWRWAPGEGDFDGGPVGSWCCPRDSISADPAQTIETVTAAVLEWRAWLEDLAERFARFLPLPPDAPDDVILDIWERAVAHLVTVVADRTGGGGGWYGHCEQVLSWFLTAAGIPPTQHQKLISDAVGGRFASWSVPTNLVIIDIAERLATDLLHQHHP